MYQVLGQNWTITYIQNPQILIINVSLNNDPWLALGSTTEFELNSYIFLWQIMLQMKRKMSGKNEEL